MKIYNYLESIIHPFHLPYRPSGKTEQETENGVSLFINKSYKQILMFVKLKSIET